jgi:hypothetical protein
MTGAHKLKLQDVEKLRELFDQGINNQQIAENFVSSSGRKVSTEHVRMIRSGRRWNFDTHSFIVKEHLQMQDEIVTQILEDEYTTELSSVLTKKGNYHIYLRSKNGSVIQSMETPLMLNKPSIDEMLNYHNHWIFDEISTI